MAQNSLSNTEASLDLYARVEDLLGIEEAIVTLHGDYIDFLKTVDANTLLDVGCGSGAFLLQAQRELDLEVKGVDLSPMMVKRSRKKGLDTVCVDLCELEGTYDVITAIFDMVNYLTPKQLKSFMQCVEQRLNEGGYFLCDINTLFGFENVAVGAYIVDDDSRFLAIDSDFESSTYSLEMTLFEKEEEHFKKFQEQIRQYYYTVEEVVKVSGLRLISLNDLSLYGLEESDKHFVILKKEAVGT
jgi:SAM-dependent methyltransferase